MQFGKESTDGVAGYVEMLSAQFGDMSGTCQRTLTALQAVAMQVSVRVAATCIRLQLHGAHTRTHLALLVTALRYMHTGEHTWEGRLPGRHPRREGAHRTEGTPRTGRIDERQHHADDCRHEDDVPEHPAHSAPVAPCKVHLHAEHGEDEEYHEEPKTERTDKARYGAMWGVLRKKAVVHVAARTDMTAPPATAPDGGEHRTEHAKDGYPAHNGEEPAEDEIRKEYPVKDRTFGFVITMKCFLCHNVSI